MGGTMIRNIIILCLLSVIVLDLSMAESLGYLQSGLDFLKETLYDIERSVKK